jgi:amino acid transporter
VLTTTGAAEGPYLSLSLESSLVAAYVLVGLDSAGELAEETRSPRRPTPNDHRALLASGVGGLLLILAGIIAAPSLTNGTLPRKRQEAARSARCPVPCGGVSGAGHITGSPGYAAQRCR